MAESACWLLGVWAEGEGLWWEKARTLELSWCPILGLLQGAEKVGRAKMDSEATIGFAAEQYVQFPGAGPVVVQLGFFG